MQLLVVLLIGESLTRINSCSINMQRELGNSSQSQQPITFCYSTQKFCSKIWGKIVHTPTQNKIRKHTGQKKTQIVHFIDTDPKKHNLEPDPRFQLLGSTATLKYLRVFICSFHVNFKKINLMICFCLTVQCLFYIK